MYKIQAANNVSSELLTEYPSARETIINEMLIGFAKEMYKNNCFELFEESGKGGKEWLYPNETEFRIEGFVMTPKELKEAIETLALIKSALPESMRGYANHLHSLLTKAPTY